MEEYLQQISTFKNLTIKEYTDDWKLQRIVERTLQMLIETCVDISGHIISEGSFRVPTTYADTFRVLNDEKILDDTLSRSMENMVKFRNIVVHDYDRVDPEIVIGILKKHLIDFESFKNSIIRYLKTVRR